jgi:hypothetical protein
MLSEMRKAEASRKCDIIRRITTFRKCSGRLVSRDSRSLSTALIDREKLINRRYRVGRSPLEREEGTPASSPVSQVGRDIGSVKNQQGALLSGGILMSTAIRMALKSPEKVPDRRRRRLFATRQVSD